MALPKIKKGDRTKNLISSTLLITLISGLLLSITVSGFSQTVIAWGVNTSGQTNVPASATNVIAVAAGNSHSLALRDDGIVVSWGSISTVPAGATNVIAIAAGGGHNVALRADGGVLVWGNNTYGQTNVPSSVSNVVAIAAGLGHSLVLRADGTVIAWGKNSNGQTNVPSTLRACLKKEKGWFGKTAIGNKLIKRLI